MGFFMSAKPPVARRDKAGDAAQAGRLGKVRNAISARPRRLPEGLAVSGMEPAPHGLPWPPVKAAPRNTTSAPLTTNASHEKAHHTL
jgi:hypothetical protein